MKLDKALEKMWTFTSTPEEKNPFSLDEQFAISQFKDTYKCLPDCSYEVTTPKKYPLPELEESRTTALKRFQANEKSLAHKGKLDVFNEAMYYECITLDILVIY